MTTSLFSDRNLAAVITCSIKVLPVPAGASVIRVV